MIKRSSLSARFSASRRRCECGNRKNDEWTYEGGRKRKQVETDGEAYPLSERSCMICTVTERMIFFINLGGTAGYSILSHSIELCGRIFLVSTENLLTETAEKRIDKKAETKQDEKRSESL